MLGTDLSDHQGVPLPDRVQVQSLDEDTVLLSLPLPEASMPSGLTSSEESVARLVFLGASNADIAAERSTTKKTIANQLERIFQKLSVKSRVELVLLLRSSESDS